MSDRREPRLTDARVPAADGREVDLYVFPLPDETELEMIQVLAGEFRVRGQSLEVATIDRPFWIARHPITWRQFRAFCRAEGRSLPEAPPWGVCDDHPVVHVTCRDGMDYCAWAGLALPTRKQRERAGSTGASTPWGDGEPTPGRCAWIGHPAYGGRSTAPVGSFVAGASPCGALDMAGNVREWCYDEWEELAPGVAHYMQSELSESDMFTTRFDIGPLGGSFKTGAGCCTSSSHESNLFARSDDCGFRGVLNG